MLFPNANILIFLFQLSSTFRYILKVLNDYGPDGDNSTSQMFGHTFSLGCSQMFDWYCTCD